MAGNLLKLMMKVGIVGDLEGNGQTISHVREYLRRQVRTNGIFVKEERLILPFVALVLR